MKKILKGLGIFLVVIILAIVFLPIIFKGKINEIIKEQANSNLNAKLEFSELNLSLIRSFPAFSVRINELSLSGIDAFAGDTLVDFNYFQADLNLLSVLFGDAIEIESIVLDKPNIKAVVLENGLTNWDIVKPDSTTTDDTDIADTSQTSSSVKIALKKFEINECKISYDDREANMLAQIDDMYFLLKGDLSTSKTNLEIKTNISTVNFFMDNIAYLKNANISFVSDIQANMDSMLFVFAKNEFSLNDILLAFAGSVQMPTDDISIDIKFNTTKTDFKSVLSLIPSIYMTDFADIKTAGEFTLNGYVNGIYNDNNLPAFGVNLIVKNAMFKYPELPKSADNINIFVEVENKGGTGDDNIIDIKKAHAEFAQNPIDANMHIVTSATDVDLQGSLFAKLNFSSIADVVPLENTTIKGLLDANVKIAGKLSSIEKERYEEFKASGQIELTDFEYISNDLPKPVTISSAVMQFTPADVNLKNCDVNIGSSDLHLQGEINNLLSYVLQDKVLKSQFHFRSNNLNISDLVSSDETNETVSETTSSADTSTLTAFSIPSNIDFTLVSELKKVKYDNLLISDLKGDIILKNSKAMFSDVKMNLLGGDMLLNGAYDSKILEQPKVDLSLKINNFTIPAAFEAFNTVKQLAPIAKNTNGNFSLKFSFATDLDYNLNPIYETLNGKGNFKSREIRVAKSDALSKLATVTKWKKLENLSLQDVDLSFEIENGNITVDPTKMNFGKSEFEFGGSQNLNKNINYKIGMSIPRKELGEAVNNFADNLLAKTGKNINLGENIKINVFVKGSLDNPEFSLSGNDNAGEEIKEQIKEEVKEQVEDIINNIDEKAQAVIATAKAKAQEIKDVAQKSGEKLIAEADSQGEKLQEKAKEQAQNLVDNTSNPIARKAAEKAGEKLIEEADVAAQKLHNEAQKQANKLNTEAEQKADNIIKKAQDEVAKMKSEANNKVNNV